MTARMTRRTTFGATLLSLFGWHRAEAKGPASFPPVPKWKPSFIQPLDEIVARVRYYTNGKRDFVLLRHGTCVILESGLSDAAASAFALDALARILRAHPDMNPLNMDDGNVMVQYSQPAISVVLTSQVEKHRAEVDARYLDGLTPDEVLITPEGPNKFDERGKRGLLGRAFMFMDALDPHVVRVERASV